MDKNNKGHCSRRDFTAAAVSAAAFTIVPRHVLGGPGFTPPSDKVNLAVIGLGRQGMVVMMHLLQLPEIQVVSVCDVNQGSTVAVGKGSIDWKKSLYGGEDRRGRELLHRAKHGNDEGRRRLSEGSEGLRTYTLFLTSFFIFSPGGSPTLARSFPRTNQPARL